MKSKYLIPHDFDWKFYLEINKDLKCRNKEEAIEHYIKYGINEKRIYKKGLIADEIPDDFDWKSYVEINKDLKCRNKKEAIDHYIKYGINEKRVYKKEILMPELTIKNDSKNICFDDPNIVLHFTHNYGGGTDVYIKNLIYTYRNYNNIIINALSDDYVLINNIKYSINELIIKNIKILCLHNLLVNDTITQKHKINFKILNLISEIPKSKKIIFIHDYYLLFPETPNPIKSNELIPTSYNINNTLNILNMFDKVIFNSKNCFTNYSKYLNNNIDNKIILNNVPDINYYNNRIFPPKKKSYNIGVIGNIGCEHKGRDLLDKISSLFIDNNINNNIIVLGEYNIPKKNIIITGKYENSNIFELIKKYDIDYFLFVSTFEETYSFTLSIALHTGLPIIYNNIGSYTERLEYDNCFSFTESEYFKIIESVKYIESKSCLTKNNITFPELNKNFPDLSDYLLVDNDKFNIDINNISVNLKNKNICFINFVNIHNGVNILMDQINYIKNTKLYDKLDYIFIIMLGEYCKIPFSDFKIKVLYYSKNNFEHEYSVLNIIKKLSDNISFNLKILYIHVKGVLQKPNSYEWRKYLEYFLIENHNLCLESLNKYNCVGVNQQYYFNEIDKYRNHFSGNFWWANSSYMKTLPQIPESEDRYVYEHWLIGNLEKNDYRNFISLHHTDYNLYETKMNPEIYKLDIIKENVINNIKSELDRKIIGIYFICCKGIYLKILKEQIDILISSGLYSKSDTILCFICNYTEECLSLLNNYSKLKIIKTKENLYEKFAINSFKKYIDDDKYYLYYIHTKGITRKENCFVDWRNLCNYFTIKKWYLSVGLLKYYDCVGTNLKNFPKKHFSGNFWWSKSEHLNKLEDINDNYLSCEMYICSYLKTNYVSIYQSHVDHGGTEYPEQLYKNLTDLDIINNICIIPDYNEGDKICMKFC